MVSAIYFLSTGPEMAMNEVSNGNQRPAAEQEDEEGPWKRPEATLCW